MGLVYPSRPKAFALRLVQNWRLQLFVETGIGDGGCTSWAADQFRRVWAIELDAAVAREVQTRLADKPNVTILQGDSATRLKEVVPELDAPALCWLDAHFMGDFASDAPSECPLIDEIRVINTSPLQHIIMIDDARFFMKPPPMPYRWRLWPDLHELVAALDDVPGGRYSIVIDDLIIAVPRAGRGDLVGMLRPL